MALDPNIILQAQQPVQLQNPLDAAAKAMTMKSLVNQQAIQGQQLQQGQQELADQQSLRDAFKNNVTTDANGNPSLDRQGVLAALYKSGNPKSMDYAQTWANQDLERFKQQSEMGKQLAWSVQDANSYQMARQKALQLGLPNAQLLPEQFDPNFVKNWQMHSLEGDKQATLAMEQKKIDDSRAQRQHEKGMQTMQQVQSMLEATRGQPAAQQAEKDLYASAKLNSLIGQTTDPNQMNMTNVRLAAAEMAKIAQGGVPTTEELKGLTPSTVPSEVSELAQRFLNKPTPANAGAFVKQMQDYSNTVANDAKSVIKDRYGRIIETRRAQLGDDNYKALQDQYVNRFNKLSQPSGLPQDGDTKDYNGVTYKVQNGHWVPQAGK